MVSEKMVIDIDNLSEEGELKRSPDKQNFSDDDADTQDSLEIKPPQAVVHLKKSSGSSHRRGDKHSDRSGNERRDKDYVKSSSRHHDDRHHREKQRESRYRRHEPTDQYTEKTRRSEPTKRDRDSSRYERKERSTGDRVLEDLRERLLDKRRERRDDSRDYKVESSSRSSDSRREESSSHRRIVIEDPREQQQQQQQQQQQRSSNGRHSMRHSDPNREKRHKRSHKHERTRDREKELTEREIAHREKRLRHQQHQQQKQQQQQQQQQQRQGEEEEEDDDDDEEEEEEEQPMEVDDYDSPEPVEPEHRHYRQHHQSLPPQKDPKDMNEQELRRHRLIEAEREMALMKKNSQLALEARRQKRGGEKRSHSPDEEALDPSVVHLSEDESEEKTDHSSSARASSGERSEESSDESSNSTDTDESTESPSTRSRSESEHLRSPAEKSDEPRSPEPVEESKSNGVEQEEEMQLEKDPIEPQIELPPYFPAIQGCRNVEEYKCLNRIAEGTYGIVYRAEDKRTKEIVALKRLKMEKEKEGFPITSLREINTLLKAQHPNIVTVREIVVGSNMDKIFIVMDFIEHDLKSLMETMKAKNQAFIPAEVKCLMQQLLKAVAHLHDNWILHRDLKTSNLLLSHKGILKVGDFGLAREYGSPLKRYTSIVVTLWYRAPELLLGSKEYSTPVDMWSVGCIFAELLRMDALFPGKSETDLLNRVFKELGTPNDKVWPGYSELPLAKKMVFAHYPVNNLRQRFGMSLTEMGVSMLNKLLTYDPKQRITAEDALKHDYFTESPLPIDPSMFPTWPAKSEFGLRTTNASPKPPSGGKEFKQLGDDEDNAIGFHMGSREASRQLPVGGGFHLKF